MEEEIIKLLKNHQYEGLDLLIQEYCILQDFST